MGVVLLVVVPVMFVVVAELRLRSTQTATVIPTKKSTPMIARVLIHEIGHMFLLSVSLSSAFLQRHTNNIECELKQYIETIILLEKHFIR